MTASKTSAQPTPGPWVAETYPFGAFDIAAERWDFDKARAALKLSNEVGT
jgi:hypothetical protein